MRWDIYWEQNANNRLRTAVSDGPWDVVGRVPAPRDERARPSKLAGAPGQADRCLGRHDPALGVRAPQAKAGGRREPGARLQSHVAPGGVPQPRAAYGRPDAGTGPPYIPREGIADPSDRVPDLHHGQPAV